MCDRTIFKYCCGFFPQRVVWGFMASLGICVSYTLRNCLPMAINEMVKTRYQVNITDSPDICPLEPVISHVKYGEGEFEWSEEVQHHLQLSFYYSYVITHLPGGIIADRCGGKYVLVGGILASSISTLCSPLAAKIHYVGLFLMRFIGGLGSGVIFPSVNSLLAHWIPQFERGRMGAIIYGGAMVGYVIIFSLSGALSRLLGWRAIFYFFGVAGLIWCFIFNMIGYSRPADHPFITNEEKELIETSIPGLGDLNVKRTPIFPVLTSCPVWAILVGEFGHNWSLLMMIYAHPKYMESVLRYAPEKSVLSAALPCFTMWITALFAGAVSDFLIEHEIFSVVTTRKTFTFIAQVGPGFACVATIYAGCNRALVLSLYTLGMGLMGPYYSSININSVDLSPNHAGYLMAIINGSGMFLRFVTIDFMVVKNTHAEWQTAFWTSNFIVICTGIWYCIFASSDLQSWNEPPEVAIAT